MLVAVDADEMRRVFALDQRPGGAVRLVADHEVEVGQPVYLLRLLDYQTGLVSGKDDGQVIRRWRSRDGGETDRIRIGRKRQV